jgi:glycosyltransferase involved in cell wall biosynthesis
MDKVSVIIPTLNEEQYIAATIASAQVQDGVREIIVVDAGSTDATAQVVAEIAARDARVQFIPHHPPVGGQRTLGGMRASGDLLLFIDADVMLPEDFVRSAIARMQQRRASIAIPYYSPGKSTLGIRATYFFFNMMFLLFARIAPSGAGGGILVRSELFRTLGGFDPSLTYDDIAFIRKAARRGKFIVLSHHIVVSDRRFRSEGVIPMLLKYLLLSIFFIFGLFRLANVIKYPFAQYGKLRARLKK